MTDNRSIHEKWADRIFFGGVTVVVCLVIWAILFYNPSKAADAVKDRLTWTDLGLVGGSNSSSFRVYEVTIDGTVYRAFAGSSKIEVLKR